MHKMSNRHSDIVVHATKPDMQTMADTSPHEKPLWRTAHVG